MINVNEKLTIYYDDNSSFSDYSTSLCDYARGSASLTFVAAEDYLYVGFYKPINVFYAEMTTANTNAATMTVKYYNGSSFVAVAGQHDDSAGFTRSGFVRWDRNQTSEAATTVNSSEKYWYQISLSADTSAMVINGINIVFSDDIDLKREVFDINNFKSTGESSFILTHAAARDEIIQELRADGKYKEDFTNGRLKDITSFDLLDISQVKLASTYLCLAKIMLQASDEVDDLYMQKSATYRGLYNKCMNTMYLNVDTDDDGVQDNHEELGVNTSVLVRR